MAIIDRQVDYPDGDAYSSGDFGIFHPGEKILRIGNPSTGAGPCSAFARFTGISGLAGATINSAQLEIDRSGEEGAAQAVVRAERSQSPAQIISGADHRNRPRTVAGARFDGPYAGGVHFVDITAVIQELADNFDPDVITILIDEDGSAFGNSADWLPFEWGVGGQAPQIHIDYVGGEPPPPAEFRNFAVAEYVKA